MTAPLTLTDGDKYQEIEAFIRSCVPKHTGKLGLAQVLLALIRAIDDQFPEEYQKAISKHRYVVDTLQILSGWDLNSDCLENIGPDMISLLHSLLCPSTR